MGAPFMIVMQSYARHGLGINGLSFCGVQFRAGIHISGKRKTEARGAASKQKLQSTEETDLCAVASGRKF
jgi:hypothetical protein